ncbi:MAG: nucleotidyl transferase AbiEii/AbiGii toxin family protein [Nitrosopumilus sp.]|nr:nucleotidyl transferase AbiEii/AbiGii toxin family protein [Nitrosopumilus sp.]
MVAILTNDEIRVLATQRAKPAGVIDKDYALEWLLYGIYHKDSKIRNSMIFKGGTSIRKIFFPGTWRFSEDLDFTILPDTDPETITSGFEEAYDILENESGIKYEGEINVPDSGRAILGFVHFTGPIGMKNKIKINASRIEKMADPVATQTVTTSYADLEDFQVSGYTLNEVVAEKIRSTMQRSKVRDYYDIWKMFGKDSSHGFDTELIGGMVKQKCTINNIEYNPSKIFDSGRLDGLKEHWKKELERLVVEELPEPDKVFSDVKDILEFLPEK